MAEVSFNSVSLLVFVLYFHVEAYYYLCYNNFIYFNKLLKVDVTKLNNSQVTSSSNNVLYFIFFLLAFFFQKAIQTPYSSIIFLTILFLYFLDRTLLKLTNFKVVNNVIHLILPTFSVFLFFVFFVKSLLVLFFFIELYSVLYYFCFLTSYNFTNENLLKYKNGILFLL